MTLIAVVATLVIGLLVAGAVFLVVPYIIGAGANAVSGAVTGRSLNLGCLGYIVVAVLGVVVGNALIGQVGPRVFDIHIIPAFVGALLVSIVLSLMLNRRRFR